MPRTLCSSCQSQQQQQLFLDCTHHLCLPCLSHFLQTNQQEEMLSDELEIVCPTCSHRTTLPIPLAYKLVRDVAFRPIQEMICLDCKDGLFSVSEYASGKHRDHHVKTVDSALPILRDVLEGVRLQLQQSVQNLQRQCEKLQHYRVLLNDIVTANVKKIRTSFMNLKEEIARKQIQVLDSYQDIVEDQIGVLDNDIQQVQEVVAQGEEHLRWIYATLQQRGEKGFSFRDKTEVAEYYLKHHQRFDQFVSFEQGTRKRVPSHLEIVKINRDIIKTDVFKPFIAQVRLFSLIEANEQKEPEEEHPKKAVSGLGPDYFDVKRQELHGSIFKTTQPRVKSDGLYQKQQLIRQMAESNKKRAVKIPQGKKF